MPLRSFVAEMFGGSLFKPLQAHMAEVRAAVELLPDFIDAAQAGSWDSATAIQGRIVEREHAADALKKDLRIHLPKSLFMAVDRRDVLEMLAMQDKIANKAKDISGLMLGRQMALPPPLAGQYLAFLRRTRDAVIQAQKAIEELDELLETGFKGEEARLVDGLIDQLNQIEHDTDELQVQLRAELRKLEGTLPPVDVMFLYKVFEWTGDLADRAQAVGSHLDVMLAR